MNVSIPNNFDNFLYLNETLAMDNRQNYSKPDQYPTKNQLYELLFEDETENDQAGTPGLRDGEITGNREDRTGSDQGVEVPGGEKAEQEPPKGLGDLFGEVKTTEQMKLHELYEKLADLPPQHNQ